MPDVIVYMQDGDLYRIVPYYEGGFSVESEMKHIPEGATSKVVDGTKMPNPLLRNAWKLNADKVDIDIPKGKEISHSLRRAARETALKDNIEIIKQGNAGIPLKAGQSVETAQSENAAFMLIDDANQISIDNATNEADLLAVIEIL